MGRLVNYWEVLGTRTAVEYDAGVMEQVRDAVVEGHRALGHGGLEVGGVLFGSFTATGVHIWSSRPLASEHVFGPSLRLSGKDLAAVEEMLASPPGGLEPVGWYRSHTRGPSQVDPSDREVFDRFFSRAGFLLLLLKPAGGLQVQASFLARGDDGLVSDQPIEEMLLRPFFEITEDEIRHEPEQTSISGPALSASEPAFADSQHEGTPAPKSFRFTPWKAGFAGLAFGSALVICFVFWQASFRAPLDAIGIQPASDGHHLIVFWDHTGRGAARGTVAVSDDSGQFTTEIPGDKLSHGVAVVPLVGGKVRATLKVWRRNGEIAERTAAYESAAASPPAPSVAELRQEVADLIARNHRLEIAVAAYHEMQPKLREIHPKAKPKRRGIVRKRG